tara:strand:+ start:850 stop:3078 length:2229 start_codon:yes stop_codon:yes gene_type:complete
MRSCLAPVALVLASSLPAQQSSGDQLQFETAAYAATFSSEHAQLTTRGALLAEQPSTLQFHYQSSGRSNSVRRRRAIDAVPQKLLDKVRYQHAGVVEVYRTDALGIEQSFHFAERPAGQGDLVILIGVAGNVLAMARDARHEELRFTQAGHTSIVYGEAIAFDRRNRRVDVLTSYDGQGQIALIVPAEFVDIASYPMVVDPAIGSPFDVGSGINVGHPDIAYDLELERHMVAFVSEALPSFSKVLATRLIRNDGTVVATSTVATAPSDLSNPDIAVCRSVTGNAFLVVWEEGSRIRGRLMDGVTGAPRAPAFNISNPAPGEVDRRPTVAGPGELGMIVAWDRTFVGDSNPRGIRSCEMRWASPFAAANVTINPMRSIQNVTSGYVQNAKLASSSHSRFVSGGSWAHNRLVWERFWNSPAPGDFDLETCAFRARPDTAQFTLTQSPALVPGANQIGANERLGDIGSVASTYYDPTDQQYCVAWADDGDVLAQMYDNNGPVGSGITVRASPLEETNPIVSVGSCEFTIVYGETATPGSPQLHVYAARVLRDGTVATGHKLVDGTNTAARGSIKASSRPTHTANEWLGSRSLIVWKSTTWNGLIRGRFFEPITASLSPYGSACPGPLGELPAIGTTGGNPYIGNAQFAFTVTNAPPISLAVLVASSQLSSTAIPGAPGCSLYVGLPFAIMLPTATNSLGDGSVPLPMPCSIPNGATLAFQWAIYSPAANAFGWIVSNDIDVTWQH